MRLIESIRNFFNAPVRRDLAAVAVMLDEINFRLLRVQPLTIIQAYSKEFFFMQKMVYDYDVTLLAVPEGGGAVSQELKCSNVFLDVDNPSSVYEEVYGPGSATFRIRAVEGATITLELSYTNAVGTKSAIPLVVTREVNNEQGPVVPADAISIVQVGSEQVELPDPVEPAPVEPVIEPVLPTEGEATV